MAISNFTMRPVENEMITAVNAIQRAVGPLYPEISKKQPMRPAEIELLESVNILRDKFELILNNLTMYGKSMQDSTTGAQLLDDSTSIRGYRTNANGVLIVSDNYSTSDFIAVDANTSYYYTQIIGSQQGYSICEYDSNKEFIKYTNIYGGTSVSGAKITGGTTAFVRISYLTSLSESVMISKGTTATPYEPYTGGKPSPSPEYPQPITSIENLTLEDASDAAEWSVPIDLQGHQLRSLPDGTRDELALTNEGDNWSVTLLQRVGMIVLDGTLPIALVNWRPSNTSVGFAYNRTTIPSADKTSVISDNLTQAKYVDLYNQSVDNGISLASIATSPIYGLFLRVAHPELTTQALINTWLANNPITVNYPLVAPIEINLGTIELPDIDNINNVHILANDNIVVEYDYDYAIRRIIING